MSWMWKWGNIAIDLVLLVASNIAVVAFLLPAYATGGAENVWRTCCACAVSMMLCMSAFVIVCILDDGANSSIAQDTKTRTSVFILLCVAGYAFTLIGTSVQWSNLELLGSIGACILPALVGGAASGVCLGLISPFNVDGMKKKEEQLRTQENNA